MNSKNFLTSSWELVIIGSSRVRNDSLLIIHKEFSIMVAHYNKSNFGMPKDLLKRFDDLYNSMMLDKCKKHNYMKSRRKFKKLVSMVERKVLKEINHHEYRRCYKGYSVFSFFTDNGILCYTQHAKQSKTDIMNMNRAIQAYIYKKLVK